MSHRVQETMNLDGRAQDLERAAEGIRAAQERMAGLTGTGTAAKDQVRVTWSNATGLDELDIDPRAMRLRSADLSAAVKQAITAAMDDLRRKSAEVLREETGTDPDRESASAQDLQDAYNRQMSDITARVEQASRSLRDTLRP